MRDALPEPDRGDRPYAIVHITRFDPQGNLFAKLEMLNPGSSAKDRAAAAMLRDAVHRGKLLPGGSVVEPTSGNTGVGLAWLCAILGYRLILTMPETMSVERRRILAAYGAQIVLTPGAQGMAGAIEEAKRIVSHTGAFMPQQFENQANPRAHELTTGPEILSDMDGRIGALVCAVGTGGTLTGVARAIKAQCPDAMIVAVEPDTSAVLSGGKPGAHKIRVSRRLYSGGAGRVAD
jgi:cysteine synthase A